MEQRTRGWSRNGGAQFTTEPAYGGAYGGGYGGGYGPGQSSNLNKPTAEFNRKAFGWNRGPGGPAAEAQAPKTPAPGQQVTPPTECPNRIYEIQSMTGEVRAEPHRQARLKGKKSRGGKVICSEITMNGWLKLSSEPGWLLCHMQGIDNIAEVALPVDGTPQGLGGPVDLAVPDYQPQGMCCLEVVFKSGVPVRSAPSRSAETLCTLRQGEYVFAQCQNFDGWIRLASQDGWMLAHHQEWGALLKPRSTQGADVWALNNLWAAARRRPGSSAGLTPKDVETLKELERKVLVAASSLYDQHATESKMQELVTSGLLLREDLERSEHWVFQRLFAGVLRERIFEEEKLMAMLPDFRLSPRTPPLWGAEEEYVEEQGGGEWNEEQAWQDGGVGEGGLGYDPNDPAFEGTTAVEFNGKTYIMAPNNVIFDPPNETPIGIWNNDTNRIDPAAGRVPGCPYPAISYFGKNYLLMPDGKLLEPDSQKVVGTYNADTNEMDLKDDPQKAAASSSVNDPVFDDDEPVDPEEYLERGRQMFKAGRPEQAVVVFDRALKACLQRRTVDVELECTILRARAMCHNRLGNFRELRDDAERILGASPRDAEAEGWKRKASEGIRRGKFGLADEGPQVTPSSRIVGSKQPERKAPCPHCNGLASKCAKCGIGMERCANCASIVSRSNCCSKCHCTYYCGRECQRAHWKVHKLECRPVLSAEE